MKKIVCFIFLVLCSFSHVNGQDSLLYQKGQLGTMFHPKHRTTIAQTIYHGKSTFTANLFLPFLEEEWDPYSGDIPYVVCTKGIALCAFKEPLLGLYAPTEVAGGIGAKDLVPFADVVTDKQAFNPLYKPIFEDLSYLNKRPPVEYKHPLPSDAAVSILEATQKFTKFTHDNFGWQGFDKEGNKVIKSILTIDEDNTRYDPDSKYIFYGRFYNMFDKSIKYETSRDIIGHEITHGIIDHLIGDDYVETEADELLESFCDIIGMGFMNMQEVPFIPRWSVGSYIGKGAYTGFRSFEEPKLFGFPNTYKGELYLHHNHPDYDPHINSTVASHAFYAMVNGKKGFIDEDPSKESCLVRQIVPDDSKGSLKIALKIFFKAFTEKFTVASTYFDMRNNTLQAAQELGYPVGSHVYVQIMNAWHAVGVGGKWDPGKHNLVCPVTRNAESWYNGNVSFDASEATIEPNPQSSKIYFLSSCATPEHAAIKTRYDSDRDCPEYVDGDNDNNYSPENNVNESQTGVTIHWAHELASRYLSNMEISKGLKYTGYGSSSSIIPIETCVGCTLPIETAPSFNPENNTLNYPLFPTNCPSSDQIISTLMDGVYYHELGYLESGKYINPEASAIKMSLGNIFALAVKNGYRAGKLLPAIWTFGEDLYTGSDFIHSFSNPKSKGQAMYFLGENYDPKVIETVSGVMNYWFYLLVKGTGLEYPNGWPNEKGELCTVFGIDTKLAEQIVFIAFTKYLPPNPTFEDMRFATLQALVNELGHAANSPAYIAVTDAWHAVGVGEAFNILLAHIPENGAPSVYPMPVDLGIETEYPKYEDTRLFELSTDPSFDDKLATVYRATAYKADILLPFQDENNPGKSMAHARFFMEPNKMYYWRSRLLTVKASACPPENNPSSLCNQLVVKKKWSPTYWFTTGPFTAETITPNDKQANVHPWPQQFTFKTNPGIIKSEIQVIEDALPNNILEISHAPDVFDAATPQIDSSEVFKVTTPYQWRVRDIGQMKGSPEGLDASLNHIGQTGPEIITDWSNNGQWISYTTGKPQGAASTPVDKITVPPFGQDVEFSWLPVKGAAGHKLQFSLSDQFDVLLKSYDFADGAILSKTLNQMPSFKDKEVIYWRVVPVGPKGTFVPVGEEGNPSAVRSIMIDHNLIPAVILTGPKDVVPVRFGANFTWDPVVGAQTYEFSVARTMDQVVPANGAGSTPNTNITLLDMDILPPGITGGYTWTVRAGAKDPQTQQMVFGKWAAPLTYKLRPDKVLSIKPVEESDVDPPEQKADLTFTAKQNIEWAPSGYKFQLKEEGSVVFEKLLPTLESVKLYQLHCNTGYKYTFAALNDDISSVTTWKEFLTLGGNACSDEGKPDKPTETPPVGNGSGISSLGFSLDLFDFEFPNATTFQAKVTVIAPDGTLAYEFDNIFSNGAGVMFIPDPNAQFNANGNLPEMTGIYKMTIEITKLLNGTDENFAADVKFKLMVFEYDNNTLEIIKAITHEAPLGGRAIGMSIDDLEIPYVIPN
ncbi:M4 family metallopeptidase [Dyadobacter bucti]|uniref:M4 family metallopeptidase n=1 Tax=Dyadobacter bucti TaxID=2572203 RepID=UPI001108E99D|nr:M4 family metallopeptidase [Dyadobacter bucti]